MFKQILDYTTEENNHQHEIWKQEKGITTHEEEDDIEEFATTGWELISEDEVQLTKEVCTQHLNNYLSQGMNPNLLRAVVDA